MASPSDLSIGEVKIPKEAKAGSYQEISVEVWKTASFVGTDDPDFCDVPFNILDGIQTTMHVRIDGTVVNADTKCISGADSITVPIESWPSGSHLLTVDISLPGSDTLVWSEETIITDLESDPDEPPDETPALPIPLIVFGLMALAEGRD